ncbi:MAG: F0F1 ATP synthase subunit epsilon [Kordiimonas sp.]|nr:F0F1 ATP synthase subunit epsilon [Kordiimonas sp.]|tara:strand:+ start:506 stop:919 length:414 start_codon:yes stop_codon:yes gene_type:complete
MADIVNFELVSPERLLMSAEAEMVVVPGVEGDIGVLPGHAPLVTTIRPGIVEVHNDGADLVKLFVRGGFAEITGTTLTVLAEEAMALSEIDRAAIEQELQNCNEDIQDAKDAATRAKAEDARDRAQEVLQALDDAAA